VGVLAREVQSAADHLVPRGDAWLWNQAMMDLGATVCRARSPQCGSCPVTDMCAWRGSAELDDPARSTAGTSRRQAPFAGSDRQARGALLRRLVSGAVPLSAVPQIVDRSASTAERIVSSLVADGLCVVEVDLVRLP
jgi:A/G-specific adenine glycosylase